MLYVNERPTDRPITQLFPVLNYLAFCCEFRTEPNILEEKDQQEQKNIKRVAKKKKMKDMQRTLTLQVQVCGQTISPTFAEEERKRNETTTTTSSVLVGKLSRAWLCVVV